MEQQVYDNRVSHHEINDTTKNRYLTLRVGSELYGLEIACIKEIISYTNITLVPKTPDFVKGIINLRGDIVPVIEIRTRFRMPQIEYTNMTCIVVIEQEGFNIGLIVDSVNDVKYISDEKITSPPSHKLSYANRYVKNIGRAEDKVVLLLDTDKLLYEDDEI